MKCTIACIQTNTQGDLATNVAAVERHLHEAVAAAEFITLPENAFLMGEDAQQLLQQAVPVAEHPGVLMCQKVAQESGVWILIGSVAVPAENSDKLANTSVLINADGEIVAEYQKIHLFDVDLEGEESYRESNRYVAGEVARLVDTPWGKLGMTVCYDVRFPQVYRALAQAGAMLFTIPAAFTKTTGEAHWHTLLRARAIENGAFVLAPAQTGVHPAKRQTYGHSLIVDPWGEVLADGGEETGVITAEIDLSRVEQVRKRLPSLFHDRDFVVE